MGDVGGLALSGATRTRWLRPPAQRRAERELDSSGIAGSYHLSLSRDSAGQPFILCTGLSQADAAAGMRRALCSLAEAAEPGLWAAAQSRAAALDSLLAVEPPKEGVCNNQPMPARCEGEETGAWSNSSYHAHVLTLS